jgi:predicted membrane-bound spermidine synthase
VFTLFFLSGFCALLYEVVWLRKAFASFGIVTPVLSIVVSTFMLGLSVGSWFGGKWAESWRNRTGLSPIGFYGIAELMIGVGAFVVPMLFDAGERYLLTLGQANSFEYLVLSASFIAVSLLPWCFFMGMTYPLMLAFFNDIGQHNPTGFSFLYLANVVGAMFGAGLTALLLIEVLGFQLCVAVAAALNFCIAFVSFYLAARCHSVSLRSDVSDVQAIQSREPLTRSTIFLVLTILFLSGFCSMAMEVVWTRAFTPVLQTTVYAFSFLLVLYLFGTSIGSYIYRKHAARNKALSLDGLLCFCVITAILSLILNDPRFGLHILGIVTCVVSFCAILGYLTPKLIDYYSHGRPLHAGHAYAINIAGCILGPLIAGYVLLPFGGVKWSIVLLTLPFVILFMIVGSLLATTYEEKTLYRNAEIRRDYTATVISEGSGMSKRLLVNGVGITHLTPITKIMGHMPLFFLERKPESAIVICFGMGTTFRSAMRWNIVVRAIELIPSVRESFGYYFDDARSLLKHSKGKVVIDDGRRYLMRTNETYDVVTIDPPPHVTAAGSSLLYSVEFYELIFLRQCYAPWSCLFRM